MENNLEQRILELESFQAPILKRVIDGFIQEDDCIKVKRNGYSYCHLLSGNILEDGEYVLTGYGEHIVLEKEYYEHFILEDGFINGGWNVRHYSLGEKKNRFCIVTDSFAIGAEILGYKGRKLEDGIYLVYGGLTYREIVLVDSKIVYYDDDDKQRRREIESDPREAVNYHMNTKGANWVLDLIKKEQANTKSNNPEGKTLMEKFHELANSLFNKNGGVE